MPSRKSLFSSAVFSVLRTLCNIIFPIITFTYSTRILGAEGVGKVSFAKSFITYFLMIALLGMNFYGTREAAKLRNDRDRLSKFTQEMLLINACTTAIAYVLLALTIHTVPKLRDYRALLWLNSVALVMQGMGMEWLYQAMEEYQYIAIRSVAFQFVALVAMFLFVRDENDVLSYAAASLVSSSGSYVLNFINARKMVSFRRYGHYELKKHLRPLLWLFAMAVSIELYTVLDSTMLGFLQGDVVVGKYTAAVKVNKMIIALITTISSVLVPRMSYYISSGESEKVRKLVRQANNYVFLLSVPAAMGLYLLSDEIILLFSGKEFASAAHTMRIMTPIVFIISFSTVTNMHAFVPMGKEKLILTSTLVGAVSNFTANMILIPKYAENGAAIATVFAETAVSVVCYFNIRRYFKMKPIFRVFYQYVLAALPFPLIAWLVRKLPVHYVVRMGIVIAACLAVYFLILYLFRNQYMLEALGKARDKIIGRFLRKKGDIGG